MVIDQPRIELLCQLALPFFMGIVVALLGPRRGDLIRWLSLGTALVSLVLACTSAGRLMHVEWVRNQQASPAGAAALAQTANAVPTFRPEFVPGAPTDDPTDPKSHTTTWKILQLGPGAVQFYIGLDGINVWLILLTSVLFMPSVLISWTHVDTRVNEFYAWLLILQSAMFGVFLSFDILLFYVFFELTLVPLFFLIGVWGGPERRYAARKFLIYTLAGSLITFLGILGIVLACYADNSSELTFSIPRLVEIVHTRLALQDANVHAYWGNVQFWVFLALVAGFAVKVPLVPLHTWLPLAHVEAPTAGSVDLAGILLKVGAYGFLRLCLPLAPDASLSMGMTLISIPAAIGIIYGAFCALTQDDIKRLVAYSSVSHLGLVMLGMFALNQVGLSGSLLQMINHGLNTGALFLLVGMLYERYHTRKVSDYGGMASRLPILACFMMFIILASVGLPGLNGFVSEVLVLMGVLEAEWSRGVFPILAAITASTIILGAWYLLTLLRRTFFGPLKEPHVEGHVPVTDLNGRELVALAPIVVLCVVLGVYPQPVLDTSRPDLDVIAEIAHRARLRAGASTKEHAQQPAAQQAQRKETP
ncbi:MAG TPA: NADH-quinone oxidoreductase subunit M [Gemmataceae bacterium]|nr:NADH-quinone oxidoreductase subunit M [Gemmataceae bacterium]